MTTFLRRLRANLRPPRTLAFTRAGTFLVLMTLGVGFAAINTGNNLLFLLLGTMLALVLASGVLSEAVLRGLTVRREPPSPPVAGRLSPGTLVVENSKRWPSLSVEVAETDAVCTVGPLAGTEFSDRAHAWWKFWKSRTPTDDSESNRAVASGYATRIEPDTRRDIEVRYDFGARGVYRLTGLRATTRFPFSLFEKSRRWRRETTLTVHPTPREPGDWTTRIRGAFGTDSSDDPGRGDAYYGLREYRPGEDNRLIHWKRSAARGELVVKEYEERTSRAVRLHLCSATGRAAPPNRRERESFERGLQRLTGLLENLDEREWSLQLQRVDVDNSEVTSTRRSMLQMLASSELVGGPPEFQSMSSKGPDRADILVALPSAIDHLGDGWDLVLPMEEEAEVPTP